MFNLRRHFAIVSLVCIVLVAVMLGFFYRRSAVADLEQLGESKNVAITQAFSNSVWESFDQYVRESASLTPEELQANPQLEQFQSIVLAQMAGTSIIKVKIYNLDGTTVFSTEPAQIGQNKSDNPGFVTAVDGGVASELTHRDTFSAFEGTLENRDVLASYIPIRHNGPDSSVIAVFEVYDDVTPLVVSMNQTQRNIVLGVTLPLTLLYLFLLAFVTHADKINRAHYDELQQTRLALEEGKQNLERLVQHRTQALTDSNRRMSQKVTELKMAEKSLLEARDLAMQADQLKGEIMSRVSHELRTPLSIISMHLEMLRSSDDNVDGLQVRNRAARILGNVSRLTELVNMLLGQAQLEAGKVELAPEAIPTISLINSVENKLRSLASGKPLDVQVEMGEGMPDIIYSDKERLVQMLDQLISNAVKFTNEGSVNVKLRPVNAKRFEISVRDTGIGIPESERRNIFSPFRQVDGSSTRSFSGVGLGLSIVKSLVDAMNGLIVVESEVEQGTTFSITLDIDQRNVSEPPAEAVPVIV